MHVGEAQVLARLEIPLLEVSGLAVGVIDGAPVVLAVGDRGPDVAHARLDADGVPGQWSSSDLRELDAAPSGAARQAEAIAVDGGGRVVVLTEDPGALALVDVATRRWLGTAGLDVSRVEGLADGWRDAASRGEGLVLLRDGHVLVAKEKRPAGLVELAPAGAAARGVDASTLLPAGEPWALPVGDLQAVAWWPLEEGLDDISDLAVGPDGSLLLLSDQSRAIGRLAGPLDPGAAGCALDAIWRLPKKLAKAEGLAVLPDGRLLVAVDRPDAGRNLAVLAPLAAPRS